MTSDTSMKVNKKSWSTEEDAKLVKLIDELGVSGSWTMISSRMGDRSGKQCRERYHNHLKPEINKSAFTKEEDALVNELQRKLGNQWAKISKYFNGRSDNAVKNRWHIINRSKNAAELASPKPARKPTVPKLALHLVVPTVPRVNVASTSTAPVDLLNLYHSHSEHNHEPTSSSRSNLTGSGRRSGRANSVPIETQPAKSTRTRIVKHIVDVSIDGHSSSESYYDNDDDSESDDYDSWLDDLMSDSQDGTSSSEEEGFEEDEYSQDEINYIMSSNIFAADDERNISPRVDTHHVEMITAAKKNEEEKVFDTFSEAALTQREEPDDFEYGDQDDVLLLPLVEEEEENGGPISINTSPRVLATSLADVGSHKMGSNGSARLIPRKNRLFSSTTPIPTPTKGQSLGSPHVVTVSGYSGSPVKHILKRQRGRPHGGSPLIKKE